MADSTITGKAVISGITGTSAITISGFATFSLDTAKMNHKFDLEAIKENNFDAALIATNGHVEVDLNWRPSGASKAAARATAIIISPLATVTLANFDVTAYNGRYVYVGDESIELGQGAATMAMKIRRYDDSTQNTSLTTSVS